METGRKVALSRFVDNLNKSMPKKSSKKMISVSTKTGDAGESGLADGTRLSKDAHIFEVLGTVDELNSWLGLVVSSLEQHKQLAKYRKQLLEIQDTLFFLGAELAGSPKTQFPDNALTLLESRSNKLQYQMGDGWTTKFLLPGGVQVAAELDIARTVCRRLERRIVSLVAESAQPLRPVLTKYINRLSDYLFVLRCHTNQVLGYEEKQFESKFFRDFLES